MQAHEVIDKIKNEFIKSGNPVNVPLVRGGTFKAELLDEGINVDNLANEPFLPWSAFTETIVLLEGSGGRAPRGNAMNSKLGETDLYITSVEGFIAHVVYEKQPGDSVFRRIAPIAAILVWAGICEHEPGYLVLKKPD